MVTVEELREKWPVREVSVYGNCIVVPDKQFKREWEQDLKAEGAVVLYQALPGGTCALVRLKGRQLEVSKPFGPRANKVVYEPKAESARVEITEKAIGVATPIQAEKTFGGYYKWTKEDHERIVDMWNRRCRLSEIRAKFPDCNPHAVAMQIGQLKKKGLISPRRNNGQPLETREKEVKLPTTVHTELPTSVPTVLPMTGLREVLVEVRSEVYAMVKEHGDFKSCHEGYAVILEELEELWDEVKRPSESRDLRRLRSEALNVAASAAKFALFVEKELEASS
ncbi:hypothetical protein MUO79_00870 [Candidatus Bathyarchaeota archaeon]|nr:hypothetical protein [Candidatus Bathyarchaeota archaeon]